MEAERIEDAHGCLAYLTPKKEGLVQIFVASPEYLLARASSLPTSDGALFATLERLRNAFESGDTSGMNASRAALQKLGPNMPGVITTLDLAKNLAGSRFAFAEALTPQLERARLVLWFPEKAKHLVQPGIFCPDITTATFAAMSMGSLSACPKCGQAFVRHKENVNYCSAACGAAFRTARSRKRATAVHSPGVATAIGRTRNP